MDTTIFDQSDLISAFEDGYNRAKQRYEPKIEAYKIRVKKLENDIALFTPDPDSPKEILSRVDKYGRHQFNRGCLNLDLIPYKEWRSE